MGDDSKGAILLNLGGPDSPESVRPFLLNLFSDRGIIRLGPSIFQTPMARIISFARAGKTKSNYNLIGGRSPILDITKAQGKALERELKKEGQKIKVYIGMRYWHPFIPETLDRVALDGVEELIAIPLFPHYSRAATGSCFKELSRAVSAYEQRFKVTYIKNWHKNPLYIEALAETISEGLLSFSSEDRGEVAVLFSAHALPQKFIEEGDPYLEQVKETINAVTKTLYIDSWHLSFQSRSGPVKWIGPKTEEMLERFAREGIKKVVMVPISFVSDHIETLYEMDILYKKQAEGLGITLKRAPSLNTTPKFIKALANIVKNA
jgi:ferrochelatase